MFCPKCGSQLPDDAKFCASCGTSLEQFSTPVAQQMPQPAAQQTQQPAAQQLQQPVAQSAPLQEEGEQENKFYEYGKEFSKTKYNKKKCRRRIWALVIPLAVIAAIAAVVAFNFNAIVGFYMKTFASPEKYLAYAEANTLTDVIGDDFSEQYNAFLDGQNVASTSKINAVLSKDILEMIEDETGLDLAWVNDIVLSLDANVYDKTQKLDAEVSVGDRRVTGASMYMSDKKNETYITLPDITDTALFGEFSTAFINIGDININKDELIEVLPDADELEDYIKKYVGVLVDSFDGARKSTSEMTVDGITEKLVMVEINLSKKEARDMMVALLEELKKDELVLDMLVDINDIVEGEGNIKKRYREAINEAIEYFEDDPYSMPSVIYRGFINDDHRIVGRELRINDERIFYYLTTHDKNDFATEIKTMGQIRGAGYGSVKDGKTTATIDFTIEGKKYATLSLKDFKWERESASGSIIFVPSAALLYKMDKTIITMHITGEVVTLEPGIEIAITGGNGSGTLGLYILMGDKRAAGISFDTKTKTPKSVKLPNIDTETDIEEWVDTFDLDTVISSLKKTSIPSDLIKEIEKAIR